MHPRYFVLFCMVTVGVCAIHPFHTSIMESQSIMHLFDYLGHSLLASLSFIAMLYVSFDYSMITIIRYYS